MWRHDLARFVLVAVMFFIATTGLAASVLDPTLLNAASNNTGVGDDPPGVSTNIVATSAVSGAFFPEGVFGNNQSAESGNFIFADGRILDNGDAIMDSNVESVDSISWTTTQPIVLDGFRVGLGSQGAGDSFNRGTELFAFNIEGEQDDQFDDNGVNGGDVTRTFSIPQVGDSMSFSLTHSTALGARIFELDALVTPTAGAVVDPTIFNASSNTGVDDPAGLSVNISASSNVTNSLPEGVLGNNQATVEAGVFLFGDNGTSDNLDNVLGVGGETVDTLSWQTTAPLSLGGYRLELAGDGAPGSDRTAQIAQFLVNGNIVDTIDLNGFPGTFVRLFAGGPVIGSNFEIIFTRSTTAGPRIVEIDAVNVAIVPEPAGLLLVLSGAVALARVRRRLTCGGVCT